MGVTRWKTKEHGDFYIPANCLFEVEFNGKLIQTTVTSEGWIVDNWIHNVKNKYCQEGEKVVVGLDTEGYIEKLRTGGKKGKLHAATLQLCVQKACLVYHIYYSNEIPNSLGSFLNDPRNTFVGVAVEDDAELLKEYSLEVANAVDLRSLAALHPDLDMDKQYGLKSLTKDVLHIDLKKEKRVTCSNWLAWLTREQIEYAARDAIASFEIGMKLSSGERCEMLKLHNPWSWFEETLSP